MPAPSEDKKIIDEAIARFKRSSEWDMEQRKLRIDDLKFLAGNSDNNYQWHDEVLKQRLTQAGTKRPTLTINKIPQHVRQITNEQRQNKPAIKVRAVDDKGDPKIAEVLSGLVRHIQNNKNEQYSGEAVAVTTACESQVATGIGYFALASDYIDDQSFTQDIYFRRIRNQFSIYEDPDIQSPDGRDRKFLFETVMVPDDEFEKEWPQADKTDWDGSSLDPAWFAPGERKLRVANYWRVETTNDYLSLMPDGSVVKGKAEGAIKTRPVERRSVRCYKLTGTQILDRSEDMGRFIPFFRVVGNEFDIDGEIEVSGITRAAKDAQRMYNYWASQEAEALASGTKAPYIAAAEAIEGYERQWNTANSVNHPFLPFNAYDDDGRQMPMPQRTPPALPQAGYIQAKLGASDDIKSVTGQYDASLGQKSNETSGVAISNRQRESDVANFHYIDNLAIAMEYAGQVVLDWIPRFYDTARMIRILGEDGAEDYVRIDPKLQQAVTEIANGKKVYNLGIGQYDVTVTVGPSYATKRQEAAEGMTAMAQANPAFAQATMDLMPKVMDMPYADELTKRLRPMLPPPVQQALESEDEGQTPIPPQFVAQMNQAKQALGQAHGQLEAATQAVQEKDAEIQKLQAQLLTAQSDAARMKAETELVKAQTAFNEAIANLGQSRLRVEEVEAQLETVNAQAAAQIEAAQAQADVAGVNLDAMTQAIMSLVQSLAPQEKVAEIAMPSGRVFKAHKDINGNITVH